MTQLTQDQREMVTRVRDFLVESPERHDQRSWFIVQGDSPPTLRDYPEYMDKPMDEWCNSSCCIAGAAWIFSGRTVQEYVDISYKGGDNPEFHDVTKQAMGIDPDGWWSPFYLMVKTPVMAQLLTDALEKGWNTALSDTVPELVEDDFVSHHEWEEFRMDREDWYGSVL